jgi:hypothetical protein
LHRRIRTLISAAAFDDVKDPEAISDSGRILSAMIRRKVVFVEPGANPTNPADLGELHILVRRAYHDGCRRHPGRMPDGSGRPHTLEECDEGGRRMSNGTADEVFEAIRPYITHRQA